MSINIGKDFHARLANRNKYQGDGTHTAEDFRNKYLLRFDNQKEWNEGAEIITFDFSNVRKIGPSFANEAFAYFMQYTDPKGFYNRIKFINTTKIQGMIIDEELRAGYSK
jgi:hypothetical protein